MSKVAIIVASDFEDSEFKIPYDKLKQAGHTVVVVGTKRGEKVEGKGKKESTSVELATADAKAADFDALVIPGGYSPDHLRIDAAAVAFVKGFIGTGKTIAAVCHGPQLLIEADAVRGKTLTSFASVKTDLKNAGANWVDQEVAKDGQLVTSRTPADLEAFSKAILESLASKTNGATESARA